VAGLVVSHSTKEDHILARYEITGKRDLTYSGWHRTLPDDIAMIDIDSLEWCHRCREPLALVETARYTGRGKVASVTARLAAKAGIPAYIVWYLMDETERYITGFKVSQIHPRTNAEPSMVTCEGWESHLRSLRDQHECGRP
jgi:hypothetical protein